MPSYNQTVIYRGKQIMKFGHYVKQCRERYNLTQEELVEHLFLYDPLFSKLDVVTLSRWEREVTCPNVEKQSAFIASLRTFSHSLFPSFDLFEFEKLKPHSSNFNMSKALSKQKRYVLNFPNDLIETDKIEIMNMKDAQDFYSSLKLTYELHKKITNDFSNLTFEQFQLWASHPKSFFLLATYENHFFGMFFSLQLKTKVFNDLLNFEMREEEIIHEHFAQDGEESSEYLLGLFAYSKESASLLILHYFKHLIEEEKHIENLGAIVKVDPGHKLASHLGLNPTDGKLSTPFAYQAKLKDVILNPGVLNVLFEKFSSAE